MLKELISLSSSTNREQNRIVHKVFYRELLSNVCLSMDNLQFVLELNSLNRYESHHK
jgi:hypothetical protein